MASTNPPRTVAELNAQALDYTYNAHIPLASWLRTAATMQKEAQVYHAEGNDPQTYLLLYRHADLVLQKLHAHPDRTQPQNKRALSAATATVFADLKKLETMAPRIARRHDEFHQRRRTQQDALQHLHGPSLPAPDSAPASSDPRPVLDAAENHSLATRLAQKEVRRRDTARRRVRQAGVSAHEEQQRRSGGRGQSWQSHLADDDGHGHLMDQLQQVARLQQNGSGGQATSSAAPPSSRYTYSYHYPAVPRQSAHGALPQASPRDSFNPPACPPTEQSYRFSGTPSIPPPLPPKPSSDVRGTLFDRIGPPPVPSKYADSPSSLPPIPSKIPADRPPTPSTELDDFSFKPSAYLENGDPLRPVFLPSQLRQQFLSVASSNTRLNLETCGMLCGILKSNALFITRLVVPEQTSTSDTCETLNEEEFFDYCDKEDLLVIGWIHTHPTQTCFMSSRDLHTHVGYQVMMKESIAIVCAPSKTPSWGCFRLTDPPGKQTILNCSKPGIFHPHDVDNIYTEAVKPGHVVELANAPLEIVDMRPQKKF
ncbi:hypothetical protein ACEQ8H_001644 [Pleosporales sp. CAS-2024a]